MKKILVPVLLVLLTAISCQSAEQSIRLCADEWAPYNITPNTHCENNQKLLCEGYMVDVARSIFNKSGFALEYHVMPWKRAIAATMQGQCDGLIGADIVDGKGFLFPAEELSINKLAFYVKNSSSWKYESPESLESVSLGVIAGYGYREWLRNYIDANSHNPDRIQQLSGNTPMENNIKKLVNGRVDVIVDSEANIRYVAGKMGYLDKIKPAGYGTIAKNIYIVFSPTAPNALQHAELLSSGVIEMRKTGELSKILGRYGLQDWKQ